MNDLLGAILMPTIGVIFGIGLAIIIYRIAFPSISEKWSARCWQVGEGIRKKKKNLKGNKIMFNRKIKDLIPYCEDVIIKKEHKKTQSVTFYLKKLKIPINAVTADLVSKWGKDRREVDVLVQNGQATLMSKGYDYQTGEKIFQPIPLDTMEMIKTDILIKQERRRKEKENVWEIIGRWATYIFLGIVIIFISYIYIQKAVDISETFAETIKAQSEAQVELAKINKEAQVQCLDYVNQRENLINKQSNNNIEETIPSIA